MSGGSLSYLYNAEYPELFYQSRIEDMEWVEGYLLDNDSKDIAKDVRRLIEYVKTAANRIDILFDQLKDIFYAVEWRIDGDFGDDDFKKYIKKYRGE